MILLLNPLYLHLEMANITDKTLGIVLNTIPINDHTQFVHIYTEMLGKITCRVPLTTHGKRATQLRTMLTPMTMLDLVLSGINDTSPNVTSSNSILQIKEANIVSSPYMWTLAQPEKLTQCLFMAELINHTVREIEANTALWQFITGSLGVLENTDQDSANFHLVFTIGLIRQLGFSIDANGYVPGLLFDMIEGAFTPGPIYHPIYLNQESAKWFHKLLILDYRNMGSLQLNRLQRAALLDMELAFLNQHIPEMGTIRSIEVLKTVFD